MALLILEKKGLRLFSPSLFAGWYEQSCYTFLWPSSFVYLLPLLSLLSGSVYSFISYFFVIFTSKMSDTIMSTMDFYEAATDLIKPSQL